MKCLCFKSLGACCAIAAATPAPADALLTDVTVVDIATGTLMRGQSVLIDGTEIAATGPGLTAPASIPQIDAADGYLVDASPGSRPGYSGSLLHRGA